MFRELKEKFTKKLVASDLDIKMRMEVNVLDYTTVKVVNNELDFILFSFFFILDLGMLQLISWGYNMEKGLRVMMTWLAILK